MFFHRFIFGCYQYQGFYLPYELGLLIVLAVGIDSPFAIIIEAQILKLENTKKRCSNSILNSFNGKNGIL